MNLDLLKKLVKLANNNPNEHEANSAARRVCKMIAENDFNFGTPINDIRRNREPEFRRPQSPMQDIWEEVKRTARETQEAENNQKTQWYDPPDSFNYGEWDRINFTINPKDWGKPFTNFKQEKPKRNLICYECKKPVTTSYVGRPETFVCSECQWEAWKRKKA